MDASHNHSPPTLDGDKVLLIDSLPAFTQDVIIARPASPQAQAFRWLANDTSVPTYPRWRIQQRYALITLYYATADSGTQRVEGGFFLDSTLHECEWLTTRDPCIGIFQADNQTGVFRHLHLESHQLAGTIPEEIALFTSLQTLNLGQNLLTGPLPTTLGLLTLLETLQLHRNRLTSTLPSELGALMSLKELHLAGNLFSGPIPWQLGNLGSLQQVLLEDALLSGGIPAELGSIPSLFLLWLGRNLLTSWIPSELGNATSLIELSLYDNLLSSTIPTEIGKLENVDALWLHSNQLTSSIPQEMARLARFALNRVSIVNTSITGEIPADFCGLARMEFTCTALLCGCNCGCTVNEGDFVDAHNQSMRDDVEKAINLNQNSPPGQ
ncbi:Leucine Rich Repeat [Seminavis robusta]|uniref:Leucine Rich Repeat n=1 Tax=Seminavis robusta TaxID=568900 RepID=A0A9N8H1F4_9STRA|nr:Leucine Rich Repeat [Seminavis robusta]|eukprot:Sro16_g011670.1 Leucine Rich Repeat (383) ;mRNA; f:65955-67181